MSSNAESQPNLTEITIDKTKYVEGLDIEDGLKATIDANETLFIRASSIRDAVSKKQISSQTLAGMIGIMQQFPQFVKTYGDQTKDDPYKKDSEIYNECFAILLKEEETNLALKSSVDYDLTALLKKHAVQKTNGVFGAKITKWMADRPAAIAPHGGYDKLVSEWKFTKDTMTVKETAEITDDGMFLHKIFRK